MIAEHDLPALFPETDEDLLEGIRGAWCYGRKHNWGPNANWIVHLPTARGSRVNYGGRGFRYLDAEYGLFKPNPADGKPVARDMNGRPWHSFKEPFKLILQLGGAKEFPVSQIIAYHWHVAPPYRGVTFPQLEAFYAGGGTIHDLQCPECERPAVFSSINERDTIRQLRVHLTSGINDQHKYSPADLREVGTELGITFESARVGRTAAPVVAAVQTETVDVMDGEVEVETWAEYACEDCDFVPLKATNRTDGMARNALRLHRRHRHDG